MLLLTSARNAEQPPGGKDVPTVPMSQLTGGRSAERSVRAGWCQCDAIENSYSARAEMDALCTARKGGLSCSETVPFEVWTVTQQGQGSGATRTRQWRNKGKAVTQQGEGSGMPRLEHGVEKGSVPQTVLSTALSAGSGTTTRRRAAQSFGGCAFHPRRAAHTGTGSSRRRPGSSTPASRLP